MNPEENITPPVPVPETPKTDPVLKPGANKTLFLAIMGIVVFLIIVLGGLAIGVSLLKTPAKTSPKPIAIAPPPPTPISFPPRSNSKFASDAGVLKLRGDLKALSSDLDSTNFFEPEITPPDINLNIHIQ